MSISKCKDCRYCDRRKFNAGKWYCNNPKVSIFSLPVDTEKCFATEAEAEVALAKIGGK